MNLPARATVDELIGKLSSMLETAQERIYLIDEYDKEITIPQNTIMKTFTEQHPKVVVGVKPPLIYTKISPEYLLVNRKKCFEYLLKLLDIDKRDISEKVWDWIKNLPYYNEEIVKSLKNITSPTSLFVKCFAVKRDIDLPKSFYTLHILKSLIAPNDDLQSNECKKAFLDQGGFKVIEHILGDAMSFRERNCLSARYLLMASQVMNALLNKDNVDKLVSDKGAMWKQVTELLNWSLVIAEDAGPMGNRISDEEEAELVSNSISLHALIAIASPNEYGPKITSFEYINKLKQGKVLVRRNRNI